METTSEKISLATKGMSLSQAIHYIESLNMNIKKVQSFAYGCDYEVADHKEFTRISMYLNKLGEDIVRIGYCFNF